MQTSIHSFDYVRFNKVLEKGDDYLSYDASCEMESIDPEASSESVDVPEETQPCYSNMKNIVTSSENDDTAN